MKPSLETPRSDCSGKSRYKPKWTDIPLYMPFNLEMTIANQNVAFLSSKATPPNLTLLHNTPSQMHAYPLLCVCHIWHWMHAITFAPCCYSHNKMAPNPGTDMIHSTPATLPSTLPYPLPGTQHHLTVDIQHPLTVDPATHTQSLIPIGSQVFNQVQAELHYPSVLYDWGMLHTGSLNVTPLPHGMACTKPSWKGSMASCCSVRTTNPSALIGNTNEAAMADVMTNNTFALDVVKPAMELRHVLKCRELKALTPYKQDVWENLLAQSGLLNYPHIPGNLHFSFNIKLPCILYTQAPPNCPAICDFCHQFTKIIQHKFEKGCYISPFTQTDFKSLVGPFQSSPLSIILEPAKLDNFWITQNYPFLYKTSPAFSNPSINSFIDLDDFPTTWGTFSVTSLLLHCLPPGSQIATRDILEAYWTILLHPFQWPMAIAHLDKDSFTIDTSICFGVSPLAGPYGQVWQVNVILWNCFTVRT